MKFSVAGRGLKLALIGVCAAGLFGTTSGPVLGQAERHSTAKRAIINVTIGKPSELSFKLSKSSLIPVGPASFKVTNNGTLTHDFKICLKPVATTKHNTCLGNGTKKLKPGESQTLTITLKKGRYEYLCTVRGHAAAGMKGLVGIGTTVGASTAGTKVTVQKVTVLMYDFRFKLSKSTVAPGKVTFTVINRGHSIHNFDLVGVHSSPFLAPGAQKTLTVTMKKGSVHYLCTVPRHAELGMVGDLTVK